MKIFTDKYQITLALFLAEKYCLPALAFNQIYETLWESSLDELSLRKKIGNSVKS